MSNTTDSVVTTTVFGRIHIMHQRAQAAGVVFEIHPFEGGYDDYDGAMGWGQWPGNVTGIVQRFSPDPGRWMSGVRVK